MKKIISLFQFNYDCGRFARNEVTLGAEWVISGEGVATRKWDGTCCLVRGGQFYKRYEVKRGKVPPVGFEAAQEPDPKTGECPGWIPVGDGSESKWHNEAWWVWLELHLGEIPLDGTYELVGPKVQSNPEGFERHNLLRHGVDILASVPRNFEGLRDYFTHYPVIEGIVWHHPDGRMVKIKAKDFGIKRIPRLS